MADRAFSLRAPPFDDVLSASVAQLDICCKHFLRTNKQEPRAPVLDDDLRDGSWAFSQCPLDDEIDRDLCFLANLLSWNSGLCLYILYSFSSHFDAVIDEEMLEAAHAMRHPYVLLFI